MRSSRLTAVVLSLTAFGFAQEKGKAPAVTVPAAIDHNRVVIEVEIPATGGSSQRVHAWVDNGNPELEMSRRLATALGLAVTCDEHACSAPPPASLLIGGMSISLADVKQATIPLKPVNAAAVMDPGLHAEITIPSTALRHYDVLVDFPEHKFSIGPPGSIHFLGEGAKVLVNAANGLIQVPSRIENKKYNLALDLGSSISFLSPDLFSALAAAHLEWPHMMGAVGSANMWGADDETKWQVMRVDRVQYGPLFFTDVAVVEMSKAMADFFSKRAGTETAGLLGANALENYRVGLDYAHSIVYFDIGRLSTFPDFTVVGLTLRPEDDGRFTILAATSTGPSAPGVQAGDHLLAVNGIAVQGATMGQVWSMLGGMAGQERVLTIARDGKQFDVSARVEEFLKPATEEDRARKKKK
jgi:hypothetical protein